MTCNGLQGRLGNLTKSQNQSKSELTQVGLFCIMGLMGKWGDLLPGGHAVCGVRCAGENGRRGEGETGRKLKSAISKKSAIYWGDWEKVEIRNLKKIRYLLPICKEYL